MVILVINEKKLKCSNELIKYLLSEIPSIKSIILNINTKNTNVILGEKNITLFGTEKIKEQICDLIFEISPFSFFQVNPIQTEVLYNKVLGFANLTGNEIVLDLYCGIGTISLLLAKNAKKVYGIEIVEDAILDARKNAEVNSIKNVEFLSGDVEKVILDICNKGIELDVVVLDPPRKGCETKVLETIVAINPERIIYVSCNPSTLARDLNYLVDKGFLVNEVQPVDMFPHTSHVECILRLERVKK